MYSIGLDYGTESCRGMLLNLETTKIEKIVEINYPHGVITKTLQNKPLKDSMALQHPQDYEDSMVYCIQQLLKETCVDKTLVRGIGIGFTSCTVLPVDGNFQPLCLKKHLENNPYAYAKLWKSHSADKEARLITEKLQQTEVISRYGGIISSEWLLPKLLETVNDCPEVFDEMAYFMEAGDWLVSKLTNAVSRSSCMAGYKGTWQNPEGYLTKDILENINPKFKNIYQQQLQGEVVTVGEVAGYLTEAGAQLLGLTTSVKVSTGIIDAHSAIVGAGVVAPNNLLIVVGTSSCHLLLSEKQVIIPGISGVVKGGIYKGLYAYEAGQVAVGDIFSHFVKKEVPNSVYEQAHKRGIDVFELLSDQMVNLNVGESGIVVLDWHNGNRTPYVNSNLSAVVVGETIYTEPYEKFRALVESTAFGTKQIVELFEQAGVAIEQIILTGGIPKKNKELVQIYADILQKELVVIEQDNIPALGAAILGAAVGKEMPLIEAVKLYGAKKSKRYYPTIENAVAYEELYDCYKELSQYFAKQSLVLGKLVGLKEQSKVKK